jgi:hypothetical protein
MTVINEELQVTLDDAVREILGNLTGLDLTYNPDYDRYRAITRQLNRALRLNALEREWSYYSDVETIGSTSEGDTDYYLPPNLRARVIGDDCLRLVDTDGKVRLWAYFLPRDALHKYETRSGLWAAQIRDRISLSRPITVNEDGWDVQVPVMREPVMFRLPEQPEDPDDPLIEVSDLVRDQLVDFPYPDVIIMRAGMLYAMTDPIMQPRVQTLEAQYKDLMYQIIERDERSTDSPYLNDFTVPIVSDLTSGAHSHRHPHADERRR